MEALRRAVSGKTAAMMLTNPNTLGIFERDVGEIARLIHGVGGSEYAGTIKLITDFDMTVEPPRIVQQVTERVLPDGGGVRTIIRIHPDGTETHKRETINVTLDPYKDYDETSTTPPIPDPPPAENPPEGSPSSEGGTQGDPGPEGDDSSIAAFCERRANYQSGVEQAASQDPTSFSVSCDDLVGAPSSGGCTILEWARPDDFLRVLEPPADEGGCDDFDEQRKCEPGSVQDQIRRVRGLVAELRSLGVPDVNICPPTVCDPAQATENRVYLKGEAGLVCPVLAEPATLEPSEENCPPGTYYAPTTARCIAIDVPQGGGTDGGGSCTLSASACGAEGLSFDSNKCECVPLE